MVIMASDEDHKAIQEFLASIRPTGENRPHLKPYRFTDPTKKITDVTVQQLQALLPNAMISYNAQQGYVVVVATAREHEMLAGVIQELEAVATPEQEKMLHSYQLSATTTYMFTMLMRQLELQNKLPGYYFVQDQQRNVVLVWATPEQHELINNVHADVMGRSRAAAGAETSLTIVRYSPKSVSLDILQSIIADIYPAAKITADAARRQVVIQIQSDQKGALESLLAQLDAEEPDEEKRYFKVYFMETGFYSLQSNQDIYRPLEFMKDVEKVVPKAKISFDVRMQQLIVWGTDEEHALIVEAIRNIIGDGSEKKLSLVSTPAGTVE
jgi:nitrate reductase NapAB chaperone NapD